MNQYYETITFPKGTAFSLDDVRERDIICFKSGRQLVVNDEARADHQVEHVLRPKDVIEHNGIRYQLVLNPENVVGNLLPTCMVLSHGYATKIDRWEVTPDWSCRNLYLPVPIPASPVSEDGDETIVTVQITRKQLRALLDVLDPEEKP